MRIQKEDELPAIPTSHRADILKKVFLKNGEIRGITQLGTAVFQPGQQVEEHEHSTMYEVFYILEGSVVFTIEGTVFTAEPGHCITVEPGEKHAQKNVGEMPAKWFYFGLATD